MSTATRSAANHEVHEYAAESTSDTVSPVAGSVLLDGSIIIIDPHLSSFGISIYSGYALKFYAVNPACPDATAPILIHDLGLSRIVLNGNFIPSKAAFANIT